MGNKNFISLLFISYLALSNLSTFQTDGCTMFADGPISEPKLWRHCCVEHDLRYWFGGSMEDQLRSDLRLKSCVETVAGPTWAQIIYRGVRAGHLSPIKNKFQWSWGWENKRSNTVLDEEEKAYVKGQLLSLPYEQEFIAEFIHNNL